MNSPKSSDKHITRIILLIVFSIISVSSYSQENDNAETNKDYFANFGIAYSIPTGSFAESINPDESNGAANNGLAIYARYGFKTSKSFGFDLALSVNMNSATDMIDTTFMNTRLPDNVRIETDVGNWANIFLMAGPNYRINFKKSYFEIDLLAGLLLANRPSIGHNFYVDDNHVWIYYLSSGKGTSLFIRPEISYTYNVSEKYGLKLFFSYSYSKAKLKYKAEYPWIASEWKFKDITSTQVITHIDVGVCIVIKT